MLVTILCLHGLSPYFHYYKYITLCVFATQEESTMYLVFTIVEKFDVCWVNCSHYRAAIRSPINV